MSELLVQLNDEEAMGNMPLETIQKMLTMGIKLYVAKLEDDKNVSPFTSDNTITTTEVLMAVSRMLEHANVEVFELGMWQAWN